MAGNNAWEEDELSLDAEHAGPKLEGHENTGTWYQRAGKHLRDGFLGKPIMLFWLVVLVVASTADVVFFKVMTNSMMQYPYFVHQLILFVYLPVFLGITYAFTTYTPEMAAFPKWSLGVMGLLDLGATLLAVFGSNGTPGTVQTLFKQAVLPVSMALSIVFFKARYHWAHYTGALTIVFGILLLFLWDQFFVTEDDSSDCDGGKGQFVWWACVMFLAQSVPASFGAIYKEYALKAVEMDVYYLNGWVALFQFAFGMLLAPAFVKELQGLSWDEIPANFLNGFLCFATGKNSEGDDNVCGNCSEAWWKVSVYIAINLIYNLSILKVMQLGSTVVMFIATTLSVPLSLFIFMIPAVEGEHFEWMSIVCLVCVVVGLLIYRSIPEDSDLPEVDAPESLAQKYDLGDGGFGDDAESLLRGE
eukprot:TRINITY_DN4681_c0_g1_i1.p1 TRINITY_DN4681_c0_g1~~TRINITY_DN4681_c0_g1_i1.p1  ORF type:complete len:417 (-),score=58.49 TRINITY_DN4681_c0_g1_i1:103-1353(-)